MIGETKLKQLSQQVLCSSKAGKTELVLIVSDFGLTRFANNQIHQNMAQANVSASVRVVIDKKSGTATTNQIEPRLLVKTVETAAALAKKQEPDPDFAALPGPQSYCRLKAFYRATAAYTPKQRAGRVKEVIQQAKDEDLNAYGALSNGTTEFAVANSNGVWAYFPLTQASFNLTIMGADSSGQSTAISSNIRDINVPLETEKAIRTALWGKGPRAIEPGDYEVVLAPAAVNEMLDYMAYLGFGARAYHEGRSFLSGKLGKPVLGSNITIYDDGLDCRGIPMPFDLEGSAKKKVCLIEKGVAKNVVYDSYLAHKYNAVSTGHGLPAPNTMDALAGHLHLMSKNTAESSNIDSSGTPEEELIKKVKRGIYVSRFFYVNAHHHKSLTITGLTRDGTFMIKNGEIAYPIVNLRFTQSIVEALNNVIQIGSEVKLMESFFGTNLAPALRIKNFTFTGLSQL